MISCVRYEYVVFIVTSDVPWIVEMAVKRSFLAKNSQKLALERKHLQAIGARLLNKITAFCNTMSAMSRLCTCTRWLSLSVTMMWFLLFMATPAGLLNWPGSEPVSPNACLNVPSGLNTWNNMAPSITSPVWQSMAYDLPQDSVGLRTSKAVML